MGMLIAVLLQFLVSHTRVEELGARKAAALLQQERLQARLESLFLNIHVNGLYMDDAGLHVTFDGGIDPDPRFSGKQTGRIHLEKSQLCFTQETPKKQRTEVLINDIKTLQWTFFGRNSEGHFAWGPSWPKKRSDLPSMIRLKLDDRLHFAFILLTQEPLVLQ